MMQRMSKSTRVYLDWAAATPLLPEAYVAMVPYLAGNFGNPSAIHAEGQASRQAVEEARMTVASAVQVRPEYVTWTSGGTEGNNLAILGVVESLVQQGRAYESMTVITTKIEHPSVGEAFAALARRGVTVRYVQVSEVGKIDLEHLRTLLDESVVLFATALINSEIGTIQPSRAIHKILHEAEVKYDTEISFHLDAAQAPLWVNCQFDALAVDFISLDSAKCCGPKGVGVLVRGRRTNIAPVVHGGGQESGLRPGTENVSGIVGAAVAINEAQASWRERAGQVALVRDQAIKHIQTEIPQACVNGAIGEDRVANNINISIPGLDTEFAAVVLDKHGFAVSTKSACSGAGGGASMVVQETTTDPTRATSTLRVTLGPDTTVANLESLTDTLKDHIEQMSQY
jgi:cysteine desulfurase